MAPIKQNSDVRNDSEFSSVRPHGIVESGATSESFSVSPHNIEESGATTTSSSDSSESDDAISDNGDSEGSVVSDNSSSSDGSCCSGAESEISDEYAAKVQSWAERVPIGLGLCPWAIKSQRQGRLKYITCEGNVPSDVAILIILEAEALCNVQPALTSTLIVCPHVTAWNKDFQAFDDYVRSIGEIYRCHSGIQKVTLVPFHPEFLRWRGLPSGIKVGSVVRTHRGTVGFQKSVHLFSATVVETGNPVFGQRRIKVRFHDDLKEQYVPNDWLVGPQKASTVKCSDGGNCLDDGDLLGHPLPDNAMHRAPYPTVHLIRNEDLGSLCVRDVSRVKRKNAKRMMKLGWEGVQRKVGTEKVG